MIMIDVLKFFANILYLPFKVLKTKQKVCFISRQSNNEPLEFKLIIDRLNKDNIKTKTLAKKLDFNLKSMSYNSIYFFYQMYHIATSKIVIIDGYCIPISILKHKKDLIVMQMWHANGIIKKIGLQTIDKRSKFKRRLAVKMNMHKNYNYVFSSSEITSKVYCEAFDVKKEQILKFGTPILDYLYYGNYKEKEQQINEKYKLGKKKNIVYLPTLRYNNVEMEELIKNFDFEKYNLILKTHPIQKLHIQNENIIHIKGYSGEDILSIADYIITDYSNIAFEAALLDIPVYFYLYDMKKYEEYPGLNVILNKELPNNCSTNIKPILNNISKNRIYKGDISKFVERHIETFDGKCIDRIVKFLHQKIQD